MLQIATHTVGVPADPPSEVQLLPLGHVQGADRRAYTVADAGAIIRASQSLIDGEKLLIDYGHALFRDGQADGAEIAGWITALHARPDGIWASVTWTDTAAAKLRERSYRGISPAFEHDKQHRVLRIVGAGLTNRPNLPIAALNTMEGAVPDTPEKSLPTRLADALSLPDAASEDELLSAVTAHRAKAEAAEVALQTETAARTGLEETVTALQTRVTQLETARITAEVDALIQAERALPAERETLIAMASRMPEYWDKLKRERPKLVNLGPSGATAAPPPADGAAGGQPNLGATELALCAAMGIAPDDFAASKRVVATMSERA